MEAARLLEFERTRRMAPQLTRVQPAEQGGAAAGSGSGTGGNGGTLGRYGAATNVTINVAGVSRTIATDPAGARSLEQVIRALANGKSVS